MTQKELDIVLKKHKHRVDECGELEPIRWMQHGE